MLGDVYNAIASIPLHSLLEADEELLSGLEDERKCESGSGSSIRATPELDKADEDVLMMSPVPAHQPDLMIPTDEFAELDDLIETSAMRNAESDEVFIPPSSDFEPLDIFDYEGESYHLYFR